MTTIDQHLKGPWLAVLADRAGDVYPTYALAADVLLPESEMTIRIVRDSAMPVGDDDNLRLPDVAYFTEDEILIADAYLVDDEDPALGAEARYAQAQAMADGLNNVGEVGRLRAELEIAERDLALAIADRNAMRAQLDGPCGSCHPCNNWADETWRRANRKPPTVQEWDDLRAELAAADEQIASMRAALDAEDGAR